MGPGPAPARNQGALPEAALERPEGGGREGCRSVRFSREEQRLYSANAEDAARRPPAPALRRVPTGWGALQ